MNKSRRIGICYLGGGPAVFVIEEEGREWIALYRESAETLRRLANAVRFDFRRREQLLALAAGFDRAAERIEAVPPAD